MNEQALNQYNAMYNNYLNMQNNRFNTQLNLYNNVATMQTNAFDRYMDIYYNSLAQENDRSNKEYQNLMTRLQLGLVTEEDAKALGISPELVPEFLKNYKIR